METAAIHLMPIAGLAATDARTGDPVHAAREFDAMLIGTLLQHGGLLRSLGGADNGEPSMLGEWLTPILARQLAEQLQLGLGEMMLRSLPETTPEGRP